MLLFALFDDSITKPLIPGQCTDISIVNMPPIKANNFPLRGIMIDFLNKEKHQEKGFTLVELLVVIGIIAILTAIAVPLFLSQRQKARDASVLSDVKNLANVVQTALIDCSDADIFQFSINVNTMPNVTVENKDGSSLGPFGTWHTISSDLVKDNQDTLNVKIYNAVAEHESACFSKKIVLSDGNYLHLTEVDGFENNRFLIYGWNPDGKKYTGETLGLTGNNGELSDEARNSAVVYDSMTGGIVNK